MYVSQMIPSGGAGPSPALNTAWANYVRAAYHLDTLASAVCNPMSPDPAIQQRVLAAEANAWQRQNIQMVQVNWQIGQPANSSPNPNTNPYAAVAPSADAGSKDAGKDAPPPPPADQGPPPRASYCYSDDKKPTIYFSDAFDTADLPNPKAWSAAFTKMLADKYMYKGIVTCKNGDTIFNVQNTIRDQKDTLSGKQLIDTDWTYEPPAPGDPAAAQQDDAATATPPKKSTTRTSHPPTKQN